MSAFQRNRWFLLAGAVTCAFALASLTLPQGLLVESISDIGYFVLSLTASVVMLANARRESAANRQFWALMGAGCLMWTFNQLAWIYFEIFLHQQFPDPSFIDIILFLHLVPMIAAVGLRPHVAKDQERYRAGTLDFLLLVVWWLFLYAFVVFPSQYISLNGAEYDRTWGALYDVEGCVFVLVLALAARGAKNGWKLIYLNLMVSSGLYALDSQVLNMAVARGKYYSGSLYDVPLLGAMGWMAATAMSAREWDHSPVPSPDHDVWGTRTLQMAMLAILTLPAMGLWAYCKDLSPAPDRTFRLFTVLVAMLVMGVFVFVRQYLQDHRLISLLRQSRTSFENEQRLQTHLVQREKLASLGQLIAGAANEIDRPLVAIMEQSEKLWSQERLTTEQDNLVRKIVNHSQRTRDLVANLLRFAQHRSGAKAMVDVRPLLQRSVQMREVQAPDQRIRIEIAIDHDLPNIWADGHQLFQAFAQIIENGMDALEESGGGVLQVNAHRQQNDVVVQFSDSGPGIKEPHRVFDPFYTTKPIGRGTGLGLSAVYGIVQDHGGQITGQNKPEGGAVFVLRLPISNPSGEHALAVAAQV